MQNHDKTHCNPRVSKPGLKSLIKELAIEVGNSKELAFALFKRDIKSQYRQSILGYLWLLFPILASTVVWTIINASNAITIAETPIPYPVFVLTGVLLWQVFLESLTRPMDAMSASRDMLTKLNFPKIAPIIAALGGIVLNSSIRIVVLLPVLLYMNVFPDWKVIFFPIAYLSLMLPGVAIGTLLTPLGLLFGDVRRAVGVCGQFLMYATPVIYPMATEGLLASVNAWNPVTYMLDTSRNLLVGGSVDYLMPTVLTGCVAIVVIAIGWMIIHITLPRIVERMGM